jgi:hypothetical protein
VNHFHKNLWDSAEYLASEYDRTGEESFLAAFQAFVLAMPKEMPLPPEGSKARAVIEAAVGSLMA